MDRLSDRNENRQLPPEVLERALHSTDIMIVITDPSEDDNPIVWVNDYFCEFTGYGRSEVLGRNCRFLQGDESDQEAVRELREGIRAGDDVHVLLRNYKKDGTLFHNDLFVSPVRDGPGDPVRYFVGVQNDLSGQIDAERDAEEATEDERERFAMDLYDGVGHELAGAARMMRGLVGRLTNESPVHARTADRVLTLLRGALDTARATARGVSPVPPTPDGLSRALRALAKTLDASRPDVSVRAEIAGPISVADRRTARHLYRIAQGAVANAAEHAEATHVVVALRREGGAVVLEVRDDGRGIEPTRELVGRDGGDPPGPRTERAQRGIGLHGMRYRADLVGATLTALRAEGGGTVVRCVLPDAPDAEAPDAGAVAAGTNGATGGAETAPPAEARRAG